MINELFEFYQKKLAFNSFMSKNERRKNVDSLILALGTLLFLIIFTVRIFFSDDNKTLGAISSLGGMLFLGTTVWIRIRRDINLIKKHPANLFIKGLKWDFKKYDNLRIKKLKKYIKGFDSLKLDLVQNEIERRKKSEQTTFLIRSSAIGILAIPIWSFIVDTLLKTEKIFTSGFYVILIILILLISTIVLVIPLIDIIENNFVTNSSKWDDLNRLITECRLKRKNNNK